MANKKDIPTKELNLNRFLYLMSEEPRYVAGDPHVHKYFEKEKLTAVNAFIEKNKHNEIVPMIEKAAKNSTCPRKDASIFALAVCARSANITLQTAAYAAVKNICETPNELFLFVKFYVKLSDHKGFGAGFRKCVNKWYLSFEPMNLAEMISRVRSSSGWSHKDLIKMTHPKTTDKAKEACFTYIINGLKEAETRYQAIEESKCVLNNLRLVETFKHCEDAGKLAQQIEQHNFKLEQVPAQFLKNAEVWSALIPRLSYKNLLTVLPRLHSYGLFKHGSPVLAKVLAYLNAPERVKASLIHPVQVLIALKDYENNGKFPDFKKTEFLKQREAQKEAATTAAGAAAGTAGGATGSGGGSGGGGGDAAHTNQRPSFQPVASIVNALHKVLYLSFQNPVKTNVRYMISIDTREHMNERAFKCGNLSAYEAGVITLLYLLKSQKDVVVAVFNDRGVQLINLDKNISLKDAESRLRNIQNGHTQFQKPFDWAEKKKKPIDVFINIFHSPKVYFQMPKEMRTPAANVRNCLENYRKKVHPKSKLISMCLCCHNFASATGLPGMIDICGFDENVPKIIESFANDSLN